MKEDKNYGFCLEEYDDGAIIETLQTGDGKSAFCDIRHKDGSASIGFAYGIGQGIGVKVTPEKGTKASSVGVRWLVKFESQGSIDSMIATLLRVKNILAETAKTEESNKTN